MEAGDLQDEDSNNGNVWDTLSHHMRSHDVDLQAGIMRGHIECRRDGEPDGGEEGGHPLNDDVTSMVLTSRMVETLSIPVVTTGGIANGKTMAAAFMLGAEGVMMASRFMATAECGVHEDIKKELVARQEHHTTLICKSIELQGRALKNEMVEKVLEVERRNGGLAEIIPLIAGERTKTAWATGDINSAPMMVGQSIGLIHDIPTCADLLARMMDEAEGQIKNMSDRIQMA
jgi:nitronate monooxygenase